MTRAEIMSLVVLLPDDERDRLRSDIAATLPFPRCYAPTPRLLAASAMKMTPGEREELVTLIAAGRPS